MIIERDIILFILYNLLLLYLNKYQNVFYKQIIHIKHIYIQANLYFIQF